MSIGTTIFFGSEPRCCLTRLLRRRVLRVPCRVLDVSRVAVLVSLSLPSPKWSSPVWFDKKKKNEVAYPQDIGFFSPNPLLQQRLGLAAASSLSCPSTDGTVFVSFCSLSDTDHV